GPPRRGGGRGELPRRRIPLSGAKYPSRAATRSACDLVPPGGCSMRTGCQAAWPGKRVSPGCTRAQTKGERMSAAFTHAKLTEVKDSAPGFGFQEHQEAHFATGDLGAVDTGVSYHRV